MYSVRFIILKPLEQIGGRDGLPAEGTFLIALLHPAGIRPGLCPAEKCS